MTDLAQAVRGAIDALKTPTPREVIAEQLQRSMDAEPSERRSMITINRLEVLALKKLVLINHALAKQLSDPMAAREQKALVKVLNDITLRAELDNQSAAANEAKP